MRLPKTAPPFLLFLVCSLPANSQELKIGNVRRLPGPPQQKIPIAHAIPTAATVTIDGKLHEGVWKGDAWVSAFHDYRSGTPAADATRFCVAFSAEQNKLYVAAEMADRCMATFGERGESRAKNPRDNWPGECIEIFLSPKCDGKEYFQFAVGPRGTKPFGSGHLNVYDASDSQSKGWDGRWNAVGVKYEDRWVLEMEIDVSSMGGAIEPGAVWALNLCRENHFSPESMRPTELLSWANVEGGFRDVPKFGRLVFGPEPSAEQASRTRPTNRISIYPDRERYDGQHESAEVVLWMPHAPPEGAQIRLGLAPVDGEARHVHLPIKEPGYVVVEVDIESLGEGAYQWSAELVAGDQTVLAAAQRPMTRDASSGTGAGVELPVSVFLALFPIRGAAGGGFTGTYPISTGLPLPRGLLESADKIALFQGKRRVPCQKTVRKTWDRGHSICWVGLDFLAEYEDGQPSDYRITIAKRPSRSKVRKPLEVVEEENRVEITTGPARFVWTLEGKGLPSAAWFDANGDGRFADAEQVVKAGPGDGAYWVASSVAGGRCDLTGDLTFRIEESGPLKAVLRVDGWYEGARDGERNCRATIRYAAFAGQPRLRMDHTFVITFDDRKERIRDIGLRLGVPETDSGSFAHLDGKTIDLPAGPKPCYLNQRWWNEFQVLDEQARPMSDGEGRRRLPLVANGTKALGMVTAASPRGRVTMALRDAWQLFPKEFGFDDRSLSVHAWPKHPLWFTRSWDYQAQAELEPDNIWKLWYAHRQGPYGLSLTFPQAYYDRIKHELSQPKAKGQSSADSYAATGLQSNAHGIAIHNEMLIALAAPGSPTSAAVRSAGVFQEDPHGVPDPRWLYRTDALWSLSPKDTSKFPRLESLVDRIWRWFYDGVCERNGDYGMFNYLDGHTYNGTAYATKQVWHRVWLNNHYNHAHMLWLMYARSGDRDFYRMARRHARHVANIDICHEYSKPGQFQHAHSPGGVFHCKGFHHWGGTATLWDHMVCPDFQLLDYYLTGDRRYWDTFNEWRTSITKLHPRPTWGRNGIYMLKAFTDAYEATGDPVLLAHRWEQADMTVKLPFREQHAMSFQLTVYPEYLRLVGDEALRKRFLEYVDDLIAGKAQPCWTPAFFAGARQLTGDRRYMEYYARDVAARLSSWLDRYGGMSLNYTPGLIFSLEDFKKAGITEADIFDLNEKAAQEALQKKSK